MEATETVNGNDFEAVAENLIMDTPVNSEETAEQAPEVTDDDQPEVVEAADEQDDVEAQDDDENDLGEDYDEAEEGEAGEEFITVMVDGEEVKTTLDELKRDFSGQKYIQKRMQENAHIRKELEAVQQQVQQERQQLFNLVQQAQQGGVPAIPEYPSEELRASDPLGYLEAEAEYRRAVDERQRWEAQMAQQQRAAQQAQEAQKQQILMQEVNRFIEWMPEFSDPKKREEFIKDVSVGANQYYGISEERLGMLQSADELRILNDAIKYRKLQENKSKAQQKAEGARPVKPAAKRAATAGKASQAKKAKASMTKKGDVDSVANWLLS